MKVIFLDIDGVLNSRDYDRRRNWAESSDIDVTRLPLLKSLVDATGAKIVLSSTWRTHWNADRSKCDADGKYITDTFAEYGLTVYDKTPDLGFSADRADEVKAWLNEAKLSGERVESFVIIDDYGFGWGELADMLVKTDPHKGLGLEREHTEKAIAILNR